MPDAEWNAFITILNQPWPSYTVGETAIDDGVAANLLSCPICHTAVIDSHQIAHREIHIEEWIDTYGAPEI